jgi:hypothetical protein
MRTLSIILVSIGLCFSTAHAKRPYYGGGHHTSSHGGHYAGSTGGSSHKGGHYKNFRTGNHYGRHK